MLSDIEREPTMYAITMYAIIIKTRDHNQDEQSGAQGGEYDRTFDRDEAQAIADQLSAQGRAAFVVRL